MCILDASKAFDIFRVLKSRDMCPMILRFLMWTYCNQQLRVKWEGSFSNYCPVRNGIVTHTV